MKIAIITIQNSGNYGAMLQAFALQTYLISTGNEVEIINYDNHHMSKGLDQIRHGRNIIETYYSILDIKNYFARKKMILRFREFSNRYLQLGELKSKNELLTESNQIYDIYISGSDQIWNPNVTNGIVDEVYFCGMNTLRSKVISYASSMGAYDFKDDEKNSQIAEYLAKYKAISTRERSYIPKLSALTGKSITKVMDPVFLLDAEKWKESLNIEKIKRKPYILIYAMSKHEKILKRVKREFANKQYDIITIYEPLIKKSGIKYVSDVGPREFVEFFYNADKVITNSFHGIAFGLIFNKNLCILNNARNMNRIYDLLEAIDAKNLLKNENDSLNTDIDIDYSNINKHLLNLINESKSFLKREVSNDQKRFM